MNRDDAVARADLARDTQKLLSAGMEQICKLEDEAQAEAGECGVRGQLVIAREPNGWPFMTAIFEPAADVPAGVTQWLPGAVRPLDI